MTKTESGSRRSFLTGKTVALLPILALGLCGDLVAQLPFMNAGPDSAFAQVDFAQLYLDTSSKQQLKNAEQQQARRHLVDSGAVSALDLDAPGKALEEYNRAATFMKEQHTKEAIVCLQKAIAAYPKFVLAHNTLGLAYLDQQDGRAKGEFETATKLDDKFPGSFLNLGMLALSANDFSTARSNLEKAATLSPKDAKTLSALAFAQNGDHQYSQTLETVQRVHAMDHRGIANVHYIAAAAAMSLHDLDTMKSELAFFLAEDPTNPLAPVARKNLDVLLRGKNGKLETAGIAGQQTPAASDAQPTSLANSERLAEQLSEVKDEAATPACESCKPPSAATTVAENAISAASSNPAVVISRNAAAAFTIRKVVDETALFFAVSNHGKMVSDLQPADIQIRDDNKPPQKITQFIPQSKLPLRLGMLIDTSGSVETRFSFEKQAAAKFFEKVLNGTSDLGFVAGFSTDINVTQDLTAEAKSLGTGIEQLKSGGGTSLFDAVSFACWKLAAYPDSVRVARVLVILSDGEDNSSHRSLKQAIEEAETSGVTIYALSTREDASSKTDADKVLQVLAERSGGDSMFPGDVLALDKSLNKLRELIRSRYLVAYKAADFTPNGKYRTVHISAEQNGKRLQVHSRKGYYARLEKPSN